jgi:hypothetical protein
MLSADLQQLVKVLVVGPKVHATAAYFERPCGDINDD